MLLIDRNYLGDYEIILRSNHANIGLILVFI